MAVTPEAPSRQTATRTRPRRRERKHAAGVAGRGRLPRLLDAAGLLVDPHEAAGHLRADGCHRNSRALPAVHGEGAQRDQTPRTSQAAR
eukprot:431755-Prymnesium_polylepis.1